MGIEALRTLPATEGDRGRFGLSPHSSYILAMKPLLPLGYPLFTLVLLVAAGCSNTRVETTKSTLDRSPGMEKAVVGRATWYGPGLYGNKTASGEILQKNTLTAAHGQLPLGTKVKVTREDTNESVIVVINDRKPFKEGTVIDLAHGAADELEIDEDGEAVVRLEVLD